MNSKLVKIVAACLIIFLIPFIITFQKQKDHLGDPTFSTGIYVHLNQGSQSIVLDLDEYIVGVVASNMPLSFEKEALKAQAVIIRSHIYNILGDRKQIESSELNFEYKSSSSLKELYTEDFDGNYQKLVDAVLDTTQEKITYENKLISPVYFKCSNGMTRDGKETWGSELPYLKATESAWDKNIQDFQKRKEMKIESCILDIQKLYKEFQATKETFSENVQILSKDSSGYVKEVQIGNSTFTGDELRYALDLESSDFTIKVQKDQVIFLTRGAGHGVGLSQYGSNEMAKEGKNYQEILTYYYQGIKIE